MAPAAGHDIDYIALAGALDPIGRAGERPVPPLNLVGDFGGGGMLLAFGMVAAILHAGRTGEGQVVDAAMVDGAASLMTMTYTLRAAGIWQDEQGHQPARHRGPLLRGLRDAPTAATSAVGAIEPQFYAELIQLLGLGDEDLPDPDGPDHVAGHEGAVRRHLRHARPGTSGRRSSTGPTPASRRCSRWPRPPTIPTTGSAARSPRSPASLQPAPAPRFVSTPGEIRRPPPNPGQHGDEALADWGVDAGGDRGAAGIGRHPLTCGSTRPTAGRSTADRRLAGSLRG